MNKTEEIPFGTHVLRIQKQSDTFVGIVVGNSKERFADVNRNDLINKLRSAALQSDEKFVGYDGAVKRFLQLFPQGFDDPNYLGDQIFGERQYKLKMAQQVSETFPVNGWRDLKTPTEAALKLFRGTNLIDRFTKTNLQNVLRGPKGLKFLELCHEFSNGSVEIACRELLNEFKSDGVAKWPALTYLAFFWKPETHMFLKPAFTKEYARRVGHPFAQDYASEPNRETYSSLLDMTKETAEKIANVPASRILDNIDIHSFMWVVIDYTDDDVGPVED
ncbi:MAG: hypothetical protein GQ539_18060 [Sulfitobacter sp.]|nr:hypothetical protein [Sulfitobacter sp.]